MVYALLNGGLLDQKRLHFEYEYAVRKEAYETCKCEGVDEDTWVTRDEFGRFVTERQQFFKTGPVYEWIQANSKSTSASESASHSLPSDFGLVCDT